MTGSKKFDMILGCLSIFISLASAGLIYYSNYLLKPEDFSEEKELSYLISEAKNINNTKVYTIKPLTINLYSRTTRLRYIDLAISILPFADRQTERIKKHETTIIDTIIKEVSRKSPTELNSISGRIILESKLKSEINKISDQKVAKELFFTKFVIQ
jgi:flagellar FliL protein